MNAKMNISAPTNAPTGMETIHVLVPRDTMEMEERMDKVARAINCLLLKSF